jgi:Protein of unknown function (DUF2458)
MAASRNVELQRLLDNLTSYAPRQQTGDGYTPSTNVYGPSQETLSSDPNSAPPAIPGLGLPPSEPPRSESPSNLPLSAASRSQDHHLSTPATPLNKTARKPTSAPVPDASTITTWQAALKHVTKHLASDENFANRIRHLISAQHKHEQQWYDGRLNLISTQSSRSTTSAQVSALLHSIGGRAVGAKPIDTDANQKELEAYDKKVYAGLVAMAADFDRQLRGLGVPFYAIKHELVILEEWQESLGAEKGRLDRGELRELQKKMLQLLEDLFGD